MAGEASYDLPPSQLALLRQEALEKALRTAPAGEAYPAVLARAEAYLAFVLMPLRDDQVALHERAASRLH